LSSAIGWPQLTRDLLSGRIRFFGATAVDLPVRLSSHLRDLVASIGADDTALGESVAALDLQLRTAVASYQGLRLTLVLGGWPITLSSFPAIDGESPATSLRLALSLLGPGFDPDSRIVFYAGRPGALVDLAADLDYLHHRTRPADPPDRPVVLDGDLPPRSTESGLSGLAEYATIHRAIGVLLARGDSPDQAQALLIRAADGAGVTVSDYAARLLHEEAGRGVR
jgi:hypothetical protein